jgi:branched-chain amino acid transport system substrate-binding protein
MHRLLLIYLVLLFASGIASARSEILVGAPLPLSGPNSSLGAQTEAGVQQAIDDLNKEGIFRPKVLTAAVVDDRCDERQGETAKAAAWELVNPVNLAKRRVWVVIGHPCSGGAVPASELYEEARIPFLTYATRTQLTRRGLGFVFRVAGTDDQQGEIAADYIAQHYIGRKIAILHDNRDYGADLAKRVRQRLSEHDIKEVMFSALEPGVAVYSNVVRQMRELGVGVIYYAGYSDVGGPLFRQSWADLRVPMLAGDGIAVGDYWHKAGSEAAAATLVTTPPDFSGRPEAAAVAQAIREKHREFFPLSLYAYAAVQAWAQAVKQTGTTVGDEVAKELHQGTFETVIGPISFDDKGDLIGPPTFVWYTWRNGNLVPSGSEHPPDPRKGLVCRAQAGLKALRYDVGRIDGVAGSQTKETLNAFGRGRRLPINTNIIDEKLVAMIEQAAADEQDALASGLAGWKYPGLVCRAQAGLKALGYPAGPTDGIVGRRTKGALEHFGRDQGMPPVKNGDIGPAHIGEQLVAAIERKADKQKP